MAPACLFAMLPSGGSQEPSMPDPFRRGIPVPGPITSQRTLYRVTNALALPDGRTFGRNAYCLVDETGLSSGDTVLVRRFGRYAVTILDPFMPPGVDEVLGRIVNVTPLETVLASRFTHGEAN
jgi:hypothetical protein